MIKQTRLIIATAEADPSQLSNSILFHTLSRTQQGVSPLATTAKMHGRVSNFGRVLCFGVERELGAQCFRGNTE